MSNDTTRQTVLFPQLLVKPLLARFDEPHGGSAGGAVLLKACDAALGLNRRLADFLVNRRQDGNVVHTVRDPLRQRLLGIACCYADGTDSHDWATIQCTSCCSIAMY